jgi:hypothetical protein
LKKQLLTCFLSICLILSIITPATVGAVGAERPDYEKFGRIATAVVKEDYPGQPVYDYKYQGRTKGSGYNVIDTFVFLVKDQEQEKKVTVKITHNVQNSKMLNLTVSEG